MSAPSLSDSSDRESLKLLPESSSPSQPPAINRMCDVWSAAAELGAAGRLLLQALRAGVVVETGKPIPPALERARLTLEAAVERLRRSGLSTEWDVRVLGCQTVGELAEAERFLFERADYVADEASALWMELDPEERERWRVAHEVTQEAVDEYLAAREAVPSPVISSADGDPPLTTKGLTISVTTRKVAWGEQETAPLKAGRSWDRLLELARARCKRSRGGYMRISRSQVQTLRMFLCRAFHRKDAAQLIVTQQQTGARLAEVPKIID